MASLEYMVNSACEISNRYRTVFDFRQWTSSFRSTNLTLSIDFYCLYYPDSESNIFIYT